MMASVSLLSALVYLALAVTLVVPLLLIGMWIRDWINKEIW